MSARSSVVPPAGLTDPWLARVWRAFRAKSLSPSHLRILVALHEVAAAAAPRAPSWPSGRATPVPLFPLR